MVSKKSYFVFVIKHNKVINSFLFVHTFAIYFPKMYNLMMFYLAKKPTGKSRVAPPYEKRHVGLLWFI